MQVHHLALRTDDLARLEAFYAGVLGLAAVRRDDARGSVWLRAGEVVLMLERAAPGEPRCAPGSMDLVAFAIDDLGDMTAWRARLAAHGVAVEGETAFTLYVRDPDGRRVGLSRYRFDAG